MITPGRTDSDHRLRQRPMTVSPTATEVRSRRLERSTTWYVRFEVENWLNAVSAATQPGRRAIDRFDHAGDVEPADAIADIGWASSG